MFLRKPHSAEMYGISCRNDFRTKQKVFPRNSEILCDRNVVRHYLKYMNLIAVRFDCLGQSSSAAISKGYTNVQNYTEQIISWLHFHF